MTGCRGASSSRRPFAGHGHAMSSEDAGVDTRAVVIMGTEVPMVNGETVTPRAKRWSRAALWLLPPLLCVFAAFISSARGGLMIENGKATPIPWLDRFIGELYEFGWWLPVGALTVFVLHRLSASRRSTLAAIAMHVAVGAGACLLYFLLRSQFHLPGDNLRLDSGLRGLKSVLPSAVGMYALIASLSE